jgi:glycosyltransferase involved in cell wall biosynthesis
MDRPEPIISRTPLQEHRHVRAARSNAPIEAKLAGVNAFTTFLKLRRRPGRPIGLVAAEFPPVFDKDSAGLRLYNLVRVLCEMDCHVVFVSRCTCDQFVAIAGSLNDRKRYEDYLRKVGIDHVVYGVEAKELVRAVAGDLRWAYLSSPAVGDELIPMLRLHAPWADIMYDMTDFRPLKNHCKAGLKQDPQSLAYAEPMQLIELTNAKIADWTVVASEQQRRELVEIGQGLVIEVIPNIFYGPSNIKLDISERSGLLFLGGAWNASSVDSVLWFANEIWPLIHGKGPDIVFRIIGSAPPPPPIRALRAQRGIEVSENIPDLIDLFRYSRISVIPLRYSTGFQDRVGESLVHGVPVVATSLAAAQMPIVHDKHLLIADTPTDFANQVLRLAVDDDLWRRLQSNGLSFMQRRVDVVRESLGALMNG